MIHFVLRKDQYYEKKRGRVLCTDPVDDHRDELLRKEGKNPISINIRQDEIQFLTG